MFKAKIVSTAVLTVVIVTMLPKTVWSETDFDIVPKLIATWRYDSNFFRADELERPVFTYLLRPGLDLAIQTPKSSVRLNYTLDAFWYSDSDPVPSGQFSASRFDYIGQTGDLQARYQATDRIQLGLDDVLRLSRDPGQSDQFNNSIFRGKYCLNAVTPQLIYEFGPKFNFAVRYRNTKIDYLDPADVEDSAENRGIFDLAYNLNRRNSIDLQYQYWQRNFEISSDYTSNQAKLIFRRQMRSLDLIVGAGYQHRTFEDPGLEDISTPTFNLSLDGAIIEKRRAWATFRAEQNLNDQAFSNLFFIATRLSLSGGYQFSSKLSTNALASYQYSDYQTIDRNDNFYLVSGYLNYRLARWVAFNVGVGYEYRDSSITGLDFNNTFVIAGLNFNYEIGRK